MSAEKLSAILHHTVYRTTNLLTGEYYIGSHTTYNPYDEYLGSGVVILREVKKYGKENFKKEILFDFEHIKLCKEKEIQVISTCLDDPLCYNLSLSCSGHFFGTYKHSPRSRLAISKGCRGKPRPPRSLEHRQKLSKVNLGRVPSAESRKNNSLAHIGTKRTKESIEKSAAGHRGKKKGPRTGEWKEAQSCRLRGRIVPESEKQKNSEALTLKWQDSDFREKMIEARKKSYLLRKALKNEIIINS